MILVGMLLGQIAPLRLCSLAPLLRPRPWRHPVGASQPHPEGRPVPQPTSGADSSANKGESPPDTTYRHHPRRQAARSHPGKRARDGDGHGHPAHAQPRDRIRPHSPATSQPAPRRCPNVPVPPTAESSTTPAWPTPPDAEPAARLFPMPKLRHPAPGPQRNDTVPLPPARPPRAKS
jgi:hypothetical protein